MRYFAYGSNMSIARLTERVPGATRLGSYILLEHDLRFHKSCDDGSAKCDAYFTASADHAVHGALFEIDPLQKLDLDKAEGLGYGYDEKEVMVVADNESPVKAITYVATQIDENLKPYSWYLNHVRIVATETSLPADYILAKIDLIETLEDSDKERDARQREIHGSY